jgi:predicted RNA methylase
MILGASVPLELDRYYTPNKIASRLIEESSFKLRPDLCVDTTCGAGSLLDACEVSFGSPRCIGLDRDRSAIRILRTKRPNWILSTADILNPKSFGQSGASRSFTSADLLVLNPPFSQCGFKHVNVAIGASQIRSSVAMAYLIRSIDFVRPRMGAVAILPESLLFSDVDSLARRELSKAFQLRELFSLQATTFKGARVRTVAVQLVPTPTRVLTRDLMAQPLEISVGLTRGALPVHLLVESVEGVPFVHSTDLARVVNDQRVLRTTMRVAKGRVEGWVLLLPRVGLPRLELVRPINLKRLVQLSDCVVAFECATEEVATNISEKIRASWVEFNSLYRGTGARYVTMARLADWLQSRGIGIHI